MVVVLGKKTPGISHLVDCMKCPLWIIVLCYIIVCVRWVVVVVVVVGRPFFLLQSSKTRISR